MGNSGSMHNIAGLEDHLSNHLHHQHPPVQWSQSIPRDSSGGGGGGATHYKQQVKVLPDLSGNAGTRLRPTNNGSILHGGGTISGRKESVGVHRSRSISAAHGLTPDLEKRRHPLMERSQTQLNLVQDRNSSGDFKRHGSEPELRDIRSPGDHEPVKHTQIKSKITYGKKKKAPQVPQPMPAYDYDPSRFGWKPPVEVQQSAAQSPPPRKLRLFKTKAESRKSVTRPVPKMTEAADHQFQRSYTNNDADERQLKSLPYRAAAPAVPEFDQLSDTSEWKGARVKVLPLSHQFRREKSFDMSLLLSRQRDAEAEVIVRPSPPRQPPPPIRQPPPVELKAKLRKSSQPAPAILPTSDFQRELLEATRRRSLAAEEKLAKTVAPVTQPRLSAPIPRVRQGLVKPKAPLAADPAKKTTVQNIETPRIIPDDRDLSDPHSEQTATTKKFYFGMEAGTPEQHDHPSDDIEFDLVNRIQMDVIDRFAESILQKRRLGSESSESALSSTIENDEDQLHHRYIQTGLGEDTISDDKYADGIQVHMRPALPRRQFEIPRFSPAAAWRTLALTEDVQPNVSEPQMSMIIDRGNYSSYAAGAASDAIDHQNHQPATAALEERIERIYREPLPGFPDNKSGDSGISGDAGLPERSDSPPRQHNNSSTDKVGPFLSPWTPQQDLDEESSSDGEAVATTVMPSISSKEEYNSGRGHIFSLSLPRESHLANYNEKLQKQQHSYNSLKKIKRTVTGAFGVGGGGQSTIPMATTYRNDNWLLSRSEHNSIDVNEPSKMLLMETTGGGSKHRQEDGASVLISTPRRPRQQQPSAIIPTEASSIQPPSFNYLTSGRHVMYLPNHQHETLTGGAALERMFYREPTEAITDGMAAEDLVKRKYSMESDASRSTPNLFPISNERENLQDPPEFNESMEHLLQTKISHKARSHRFTFQSTVRQIERRRLAERLSREAEQKENQRLSELEAMRRVEEEFQKKRAREKASIRHQLRLYSMGEESQASGQFSSLPVEWQARADPDGAVASPAASPTSGPQYPQRQQYGGRSAAVGSRSDDEYIDTKTPYISRLVEQRSGKFSAGQDFRSPTTEILSEFRTPRREYVEYRSDRKPSPETTKHPVVVCQIPERIFDQQLPNYMYDEDFLMTSDNYRKDFAHGRSVCSSESELSGPTMPAGRSHSPTPLK